MSKITNDGLTRSGCCTHMATVGVKGLNKLQSVCMERVTWAGESDYEMPVAL